MLRQAESPSLLDRVGRTPLLRLSGSIGGVRPGVEVWAKAEFLNPSGSVKDRAAAAIVREALATGRLGRGQILIDASSGNTGVSYAILGEALGFPVELYLPRTARPDKVARVRAAGARVVFTDPTEGTEGAQVEARRRAESDPHRYFYADQYNNEANPRAHYESTGPETWAQTRGRITHFVAGVGTGGTLTGTARYLRERAPRLRVIGVEPSEPVHGIEGLKHLPTARVPGTYDPAQVDATVRVATEDAQEMTERLRLVEGLDVGTSSGAAVLASERVARTLSFGVVVTVLPDRSPGPPAEAEP